MGQELVRDTNPPTPFVRLRLSRLAIFTAVWGVVLLMGVDTFVKPMLIARSGQLPLLVLFVGVIGGLVAWGFTGMFIGATTLAILWTVLQTWLGAREDRSDAAV